MKIEKPKWIYGQCPKCSIYVGATQDIALCPKCNIRFKVVDSEIQKTESEKREEKITRKDW